MFSTFYPAIRLAGRWLTGDRLSRSLQKPHGTTPYTTEGQHPDLETSAGYRSGACHERIESSSFFFWPQGEEGHMLITEEMVEQARERAEKASAFRREDDPWTVLEELMVRDTERLREEAIEMMTLEIIRDTLYPDITRERWKKLGWSAARESHDAARRFIHKLRLAKAVGSQTGR